MPPVSLCLSTHSINMAYKYSAKVHYPSAETQSQDGFAKGFSNLIEDCVDRVIDAYPNLVGESTNMKGKINHSIGINDELATEPPAITEQIQMWW